MPQPRHVDTATTPRRKSQLQCRRSAYNHFFVVGVCQPRFLPHPHHYHYHYQYDLTSEYRVDPVALPPFSHSDNDIRPNRHPVRVYVYTTRVLETNVVFPGRCV